MTLADKLRELLAASERATPAPDDECCDEYSWCAHHSDARRALERMAGNLAPALARFADTWRPRKRYQNKVVEKRLNALCEWIVKHEPDLPLPPWEDEYEDLHWFDFLMQTAREAMAWRQALAELEREVCR